MPRLTAELIHTSPQFVNPLKQRELDLRGNKIQQVENLGESENKIEVIKISDNDLAKLESFPLLRRLTALFVSNNRLVSIAPGLGAKLPNLDTLVLTNNKLENLAELDALAELTQLTMLSLLKNPVMSKPHYRWYVIHKCRALKVLDFMKVTAKEREAADAFFSAQAGKQYQSEVASSKPAQAAVGVLGLTAEEKLQIRGLIARAETLEEVQRLEQVLQSGKMPKELKHGIDGGAVESPHASGPLPVPTQ